MTSPSGGDPTIEAPGRAAGRWRSDERVRLLVALGAVSGFIASFTKEGSVLGGLAMPGIVFGLFIGLMLVGMRLVTLAKVAGFTLCSVATWMIAYRTAQDIHEALPGAYGEVGKTMLSGVAAGALGAFLLAVAIAVLFDFFGGRRAILRAALVGGLTGILLWPAMSWNAMLILFPAWQAAFAWCIARELPPPAPAEADGSG